MKLLIVDDHEIVRDGLAVYLAQRDPGMAIVQARGGEQALAAIEADPAIDAVLVDLAMPGMGGLAAIAAIAALRADLPIVVLSASEDPGQVRAALQAGACGYIPKSASGNALWAALQFALAGNVYVPPLMAGATAARERGDGLARLTGRQADVLALLADGNTNKEIARALDLSEKTVKIHVTAIFKTLAVVNRRQAAALARPAA